MKLYHGSTEIVRRPSIKKCRPHNDYGPGFYCTLDKNLAFEWACKQPGVDGYCNEYDFNETGLAILDLDKHPNGVLAWLAVLMEHRTFDLEWQAEQARQAFVKRYSVDLSKADAVCGYRADDSYFSIARAFVGGSITDLQAAEALSLGQLGRQVMITSAKAFRRIKFVGAELAPSSTWHHQWAVCDQQARHAFSAMRQAHTAAQGARIFDLIKE